MWRLFLFGCAALTACAHSPTARAEVLGPCGTPDADKSVTVAVKASASTLESALTLEAVSPIPLPGQQAPNFELTAVVGTKVKKIKLSDYDGKWRVVCFYPADFTFVWPTELSAVADHYEKLQSMGVEIIAVSTDTIFSHLMFKKHSPTVKNVKYAIASDPNGAVSRVYGVYMPNKGLNQRGRFIINPKGTVMAVEVLTGPVGRNTEELIRQIQAMQAVAKNPGKAAPAGWKPGDKMITTRIPEDVGRY